MKTKVEETSLKLFLTNGVTLTVKESEKITKHGEPVDIIWLMDYIEDCLAEKKPVVFNVTINHKYLDEKEKEKSQEVKHRYIIPCEKISWYMLEEV